MAIGNHNIFHRIDNNRGICTGGGLGYPERQSQFGMETIGKLFHLRECRFRSTPSGTNGMLNPKSHGWGLSTVVTCKELARREDLQWTSESRKMIRFSAGSLQLLAAPFPPARCGAAIRPRN